MQRGGRSFADRRFIRSQNNQRSEDDSASSHYSDEDDGDYSSSADSSSSEPPQQVNRDRGADRRGRGRQQLQRAKRELGPRRQDRKQNNKKGLPLIGTSAEEFHALRDRCSAAGRVKPPPIEPAGIAISDEDARRRAERFGVVVDVLQTKRVAAAALPALDAQTAAAREAKFGPVSSGAMPSAVAPSIAADSAELERRAQRFATL